MLKKYIYNIPLAIIFILCCAVPFFLNGTTVSGRLWNDYYMVGIPEGRCEAVLTSGYFSDLETVSSYNTNFSYNDFGTMDSLALNEIESRFVEGDPRVDQLMSSASKYFHTFTEEGHPIELIYVKSSRPSLRFYFNARLSYGSQVSEWIFPDFNLRYRIAAVLLFSVCWFFGVRILSGMRILAFFAGLPWMAVIIMSSPDLLASSVLNYIVFILAVKEIYPDLIFFLNYREIRLSPNSIFFAASFAAALVASIIGHFIYGIAQPPLLTSISAELILTAVYYSLKGERVRRQEHKLFIPIKIADTGKPAKGGRKLPVYAAAFAAVILLPLFALFVTEESRAVVPVPHQAGAIDSWSWENLGYLDQFPEELPDVSDLLKHEAFQQGFMYGRDYAFPYEGEKLTVSRYVTENNEIVYKEISVQEFTENWYLSIIKRGKGTGLSKLLLSRNTPVGVSLKSSFSIVPAYSPLGHLIISLSALLPIFGLFITRTSISVRRKGQEA